jgi:hypothetical protein
VRDLRRALGLLPEIGDAGRRDDNRRRAWTFELPDNGHVYGTAMIAIGADMDMGRGAEDEHQEGGRSNRSYEPTVARKY